MRSQLADHWLRPTKHLRNNCIEYKQNMVTSCGAVSESGEQAYQRSSAHHSNGQSLGSTRKLESLETYRIYKQLLRTRPSKRSQTFIRLQLVSNSDSFSRIIVTQFGPNEGLLFKLSPNRTNYQIIGQSLQSFNFSNFPLLHRK